MKQKLSSLMSSVLGDRSVAQEQLSATVLFADIYGSTRLFERMMKPAFSAAVACRRA